jgi:CDGSH-type Zn-finger protein
MPAKITVTNNGSFRIEGDFELYDATGKKYELAGRTVISLCRCGHSIRKPFCDGTHRITEFQSVCEAYDLEPKK